MNTTQSGVHTVLAWLDGRKTYILAAVGAGYVFGSTVGWWPLDERVLGIMGFGGLAALRRGVSNGTDKTTGQT